MPLHQFDEPLVIYASLGFTREVGTVLQAIDVLLNWPSRRHVADYYAALDACGSALRGDGSVASARETFRLFAEHTGILALEHFPTGAAAFAEGRQGDKA